MDKDIKESREFRLAKDWEMAVNNYSFNPARFAAAIPTMHPTLQQSLYKLIKECINDEVCFDELGDVIDRAIEHGTDKTEYDIFCNQQ